ncbi:MAG TPA: AraC family transcriptional regulator [Gemmatimonadales bacterium]|nr:AraC family transcriptional regulator [Gemmatimonadales bacterium]
MSRDELAERIARHVAEDGSLEAAPGLCLYRFSSPVGPRYGITEPSLCVIAQGSKEVLLGKERYRYDAFHYLLVSAELPVAGHIVEASKEQPYLALRLRLDPAVVTEVLIEAGFHSSETDNAIKVMAVSRLDVNLLDALVRVVRLLDSPGDYGMLAPLVAREIIYRLCLGAQGGRLRQIAFSGGRAHRMAKAIGLLRTNHNKPLRMAGLARQLGMSVSGLHHHFKAATGMSPLQFQKQFRLLEARRLLLAGDVDAATVGYRVGYDDASHFSREYRRLFGEPPLRDAERLRRSTASRREPAAVCRASASPHPLTPSPFGRGGTRTQLSFPLSGTERGTGGED